MAQPTSRLQVIVPAELNNYVLNPSAEAAGNYSAVGAPTISRSTTQARQVAATSTYAFKVVTTSASQGIQLTTTTLPSASIYMMGWIYVESGSPAFSFKCNATSITPTLYETDGSWKWYVLDTTPWTSGQAGGQTAVQVIDTVGSSTWYLDDVTVSSALCRSFHGDFPGCRWTSSAITHQGPSLSKHMVNGKPNLKSGGQIYDLEDSWLVVSQANGLGLPPIENLTHTTSDAGTVFQDARLGDREMVLSVNVIGTSISNLHTRRATLIDYIQAGRPFVLRWRGNPTYRGGSADVQEIEVVYSKGLEGKLEMFFESIPLGLTAYDPHWSPATQTPTSMTLPTNATLNRAIVRTYDGAWSNLASGPDHDVYAIAVSPRGHVVAGGAGTLFAYDYGASDWVSIGAATGGSAAVYGLAWDPPGNKLYITGGFTSFGGVAAANVATYQLPGTTGVTGGTVAALGSGINATGRCLGFAPNGDLYVGGDFTSPGNYIAKYTPSSTTWASLGSNSVTGSSLGVHCMAITAKSVFFGGSFDTAGAVSAPTAFSVSNTTGSLSSGNWQYMLTTLTGDTESAPTTITGSGTSSTGKTLSFTVPTGSTGTNVYREQSAGGGASNVYYLCTLAAGVNSFTDTGQYTLNTNIEEPTATTSGCQTKRVGRWDLDSSYFASVGVSGMADGIVRGLGVADDGVTLYAVGTFTAADGVTCTRAAVCNGQDWRPMGDGLDATGWAVTVDRLTGQVIVGGEFTASGTRSIGNRVMYWHPGTASGKWVHADVMLGGGTVRAFAFDHNGELWIAGTFNNSSVAMTQTAVTVAGAGGGFANYPTFYVTGPCVLRYLENATTGDKLWLYLTVVDSEIVTIQLKPGEIAITSTRLNGSPRIDAFIDGDLGNFRLVQGVNRVRALVHDASTLLQAGGNAALKIVDPASLLSTDA